MRRTAALAAGLTVMLASSTAAKPVTVSGKLVYARQVCSAAKNTPAGGLLVELRRGDKAHYVTAKASGAWSGSIAGTGPVHATAILDGDGVEVTPRVNGYIAYRLPIGEVKPGHPERTLFTGAKAGAVNIFV